MNITMVGRLEDCVLLAYRVPVASVVDLLPVGLTPVTHEGWGFWNVVACRVRSMRPRGMPRVLGRTYCHVAYRIYVRAETAGGVLSGLYFVRSDADSRLVSAGGNVATDFRFHYSPIRLDVDGSRVSMRCGRDGSEGVARLDARVGDVKTELVRGSCFSSVDEMEETLKYQPIALSVAGGRTVRVAEVQRDESRWRERALHDVAAEWKVLEWLGQDEIELERATLVEPLDYVWRLGCVERLVMRDRESGVVSRRGAVSAAV